VSPKGLLEAPDLFDVMAHVGQVVGDAVGERPGFFFVFARLAAEILEFFVGDRFDGVQQVAIERGPQHNQLFPGAIAIVLQVNPLILFVKKRNSGCELGAHKTLVIYGCRIDEVAEDFFARPAAVGALLPGGGFGDGLQLAREFVQQSPQVIDGVGDGGAHGMGSLTSHIRERVRPEVKRNHDLGFGSEPEGGQIPAFEKIVDGAVKVLDRLVEGLAVDDDGKVKTFGAVARLATLDVGLNVIFHERPAGAAVRITPSCEGMGRG
jgi:hypothetical protein